MTKLKNKFTHKDYPNIELYYTVDLDERKFKFINKHANPAGQHKNYLFTFRTSEERLEYSTNIAKCLVLAHEEIAKIFAQFPVQKSKTELEIDKKISSIFG